MTMLFKTFFPVLFALVYLGGVYAQVTTELPFIPLDDSVGVSTGAAEVVSAVIVGTGASGETTYVFAVGDDEGDVTMTATLVEDASGATAIIAFPPDVDGSVVTESIACGFAGGIADCTVAVFGVIDSQTTTVEKASSGTAGTITLVVSTGAAIASPTATDATSTSGFTSSRATNSASASTLDSLSSSGSGTNSISAPDSTQSSGAGRDTVDLLVSAFALGVAALAVA